MLNTIKSTTTGMSTSISPVLVERIDGIPTSLLHSSNHRPPICLSSTTFAIILASVALAFAFTSTVALSMMLRHFRFDLLIKWNIATS